MPIFYGWSAGNRIRVVDGSLRYELWSDFVTRLNSIARAYAQSFAWDPTDLGRCSEPYFNLSAVSEARWLELETMRPPR